MAWFDAIEWRRARTAPSSPLSRGIQGVSRGLHGSPGSESLAQPSGERLDRDVGAGNHALTSCERMEGGEPSTRGWRYVRAVGGSRRGYHAVGDAGHAPRIGVEQEANAAAARSSRARRCTDGVAVLDLVEDRVSQRTTGVVFVFCLFLLMSHRYIKDAVPPPPPEVEVISFSSELPALSNISAPLARPPALVLSGAGKAPVGAEPLAVEVVSVHHSSEPFHTINCGTEHRERSRDSMPWLNEAVACTPILRGSHSVSDDKGTVKLHDLRVVHGPPARYTLRFSSSNGMTKEKEMTMQVSYSCSSKCWWKAQSPTHRLAPLPHRLAPLRHAASRRSPLTAPRRDLFAVLRSPLSSAWRWTHEQCPGQRTASTRAGRSSPR